jgi:tetratricopeptide (TPR) repeat protein
LERFKKAIGLYLSCKGEQSLEVGLSFILIGRILRLIKVYKDALEFVKKGSKIIFRISQLTQNEHKQGNKELQILNGMIYDELGIVNAALGNLIQAKELFYESLKIYKSHLHHHPIVANILFNIGKLEAETGNSEGAIKELNRSKIIYRSFLSVKHNQKFYESTEIVV